MKFPTSVGMTLKLQKPLVLHLPGELQLPEELPGTLACLGYKRPKQQNLPHTQCGCLSTPVLCAECQTTNSPLSGESTSLAPGYYVCGECNKIIHQPQVPR